MGPEFPQNFDVSTPLPWLQARVNTVLRTPVPLRSIAAPAPRLRRDSHPGALRGGRSPRGAAARGARPPPAKSPPTRGPGRGGFEKLSASPLRLDRQLPGSGGLGSEKCGSLGGVSFVALGIIAMPGAAMAEGGGTTRGRNVDRETRVVRRDQHRLDRIQYDLRLNLNAHEGMGRTSGTTAGGSAGFGTRFEATAWTAGGTPARCGTTRATSSTISPQAGSGSRSDRSRRTARSGPVPTERGGGRAYPPGAGAPSPHRPATPARSCGGDIGPAGDAISAKRRAHRRGGGLRREACPARPR